MPFGSWLGAALEDALVIDALTIYKRRDRRGRLLGLELVDGATIKPLVDEYGRPPTAPAPAYQQFAYGFAWADFTAKELVYRPYNPRSFVNYGLSPVEQIVVTVTIALSRQVTAINHYKEGNTPAGFGEVPKEWSSEMIRQFEEMFNGLLAGDFAARARIKMVPSGFNFKPWIDSSTTFNPTYDEYLARIVCAGFGIPPTQFIRSFNRATAEVADEASTVAGFDPLKEFVERLMDEILVAPDGLNLPHLRFIFTTEKRRDEELELKKNIEYLKAGVLSIDDVLTKLGMEPIGVGRFVTVPGQGAVPLSQIFPRESQLERRTDAALSGHPPATLNDEERAELGKWLRKARRILSRGQESGLTGGDRDLGFDSKLISPERRARLEAGLAKAAAPEDASALFAVETDPNFKPPGARSGDEVAAVSARVASAMERVGRELAGLVLARSGVWKQGFSGVVRLPWLHERGPELRDLRGAKHEYFDDDDFSALLDLTESLADALAISSSRSAGFPLVPKVFGTTQSMRPGAPLPTCGPVAELEPFAVAAREAIEEAIQLARARFNRLIDFAHERGLTLTELRDATARATDFSQAGAQALAERALEKLRGAPTQSAVTH